MFGMKCEAIKTSKQEDFWKVLSVFEEKPNRTFKNEKKKICLKIPSG